MPSTIEPREKTEKISKDTSRRHQFIEELAEKVRNDDNDREVWKQKQIVASNMRMGLRKVTNDPYPGYAETPIPITDKIIKKLKSMYISVATFSKKQIVVSVEEELEKNPEARKMASDIERALNGLVRKRSFQWVKKITLFVDYFLENGHAVFKIIEKFFSKKSTITLDINNFDPELIKQLKKLPKKQLRQVIAEREGMDLDNDNDVKEIDKAIDQFKSGKERVQMVREEYFSEPTIIPEKGIRIIVPSSTTETQRATRITHDMWMTIQELKNKAKNGVYDKKVIEELEQHDGSPDDSLTTSAYSLQEGISKDESTGKSEQFNVRECQTYYEDEKWVFSWIEAVGNKTNSSGDSNPNKGIYIIQEMKLPYEHGMWTYVKHDNEIRTQRWYASRGVPEQVRGLHHVLEKMFNNRLVRDEYNNAPMFRVSRQLGMTGDEIRFAPGQIIEAEQGEIEQVNKAITTDISSERLEQQAKAYIEDYQSITDFTVKSAISQGSSRTATEVQAIQGQAQRQLSTEIAIFLETLSEAANQLYMILRQSIHVPTVIGGVVLTPEHFKIPVNVAWTGSLEASDHNLQQQKALARLQVLTQFGMPSGLVTQEDLFNGLLDWLDKDPDVEDPSQFITKPQEVQVDQYEEQLNEIIMMKNGFPAQVKPTDNHAVHLQTIEQYLNSPQGAQEMQTIPGLSELIQQHLNIHLEAEKTLKTGGNTNDPRRKRILQEFKGESTTQ